MINSTQAKRASEGQSIVHIRASLTRRACVLVFCLAVCGCSNWGTVSGKVTLDDKPLSKGMVIFNGTEGGAAGYGQITSGNYSVRTGSDEGVKPGEYIVTVSAMTSPDEDSREKAVHLAPEKYAYTATSGLKFKVEPGSNTFNIKMKSD